MPQRFLFDSDELVGDFETTVNEQPPSRQCQLAARSDAHLATDASRDLVASGISACLSLLHLKLSCLKFPEDRSSTSELSENLTSRYLAPRGGYFGKVYAPIESNDLIVRRECTSVC
jgi:hypothetical protein